MGRALLVATLPFLALAVEPRMPSVRIEPAAGGSIVFVHNPTSQPLIAVFLATRDHPFWEEEFREPVPAQGDRRVDFPHPGDVTVKAAVYADGSWAAEERLRPQLQEQRNHTLTTARELIKTVQKAEKQNTPLATLEGDLKIQADGLASQPEREAGRRLILETISQLQKTGSYASVMVDLLKEESNIATGEPGSR